MVFAKSSGCADNSFAAEAPPLAATASTRGRSSANRSTSSNGGDWLSTSWVANVACVMASPDGRDSGISLCRNGPGFTPTHSVASRCDREIIGGSARAGQGKGAPPPPVVSKTLLGHCGTPHPPPPRVLSGVRARPCVALYVLPTVTRV